MKDYAVKKMQEPVEAAQDILLSIEKDFVALEAALARIGKEAPNCEWAVKATKTLARVSGIKSDFLDMHADALCDLAQLDPQMGDITVQRR